MAASVPIARPTLQVAERLRISSTACRWKRVPDPISKPDRRGRFDGDRQARQLGTIFQPWLQDQFRRNVPYDRMVRELLTVNLPGLGRPKGARPGVQALERVLMSLSLPDPA